MVGYIKRALVTIVLLNTACSNSLWKEVHFTAPFKNEKRDALEIKTYSLTVIKDQIVKRGEIVTGNSFEEYRVVFSDSSIIYLNNDEMSGSPLNFNNRYKLGITSYNRKQLLDTLDNFGQQSDGRYWREKILGDVVVGYINVREGNRAGYDSILATLTRVK